MICNWMIGTSLYQLMQPFFSTSFLKLLTENNRHVINISSIHAKLSKANLLLSLTSKSALESITRSLATELNGNDL